MLLLRVYKRVVVHILLNTRAFLCHFGLPFHALHSGSEDVRTWDTVWTRASVKASRVRSLDIDLVWHGPCTDFGPRWPHHARCCPSTLSGKAPDVARRLALMLPLPLRPDKLSLTPPEHLEEHSRYATPSSLSTGWKCNLLVLGLHLSGMEGASDPFELAI